MTSSCSFFCLMLIVLLFSILFIIYGEYKTFMNCLHLLPNFLNYMIKICKAIHYQALLIVGMYIGECRLAIDGLCISKLTHCCCKEFEQAIQTMSMIRWMAGYLKIVYHPTVGDITNYCQGWSSQQCFRSGLSTFETRYMSL